MGPVQSQAKPKSWLTKVPVGAKNIKFGPKWVENRPFGPKQRPNEPNRLSGPIRTTPEAKNGKKYTFQGKRHPADPGGPRRPPSLLSAQAGAYVLCNWQKAEQEPDATKHNGSVAKGHVVFCGRDALIMRLMP